MSEGTVRGMAVFFVVAQVSLLVFCFVLSLGGFQRLRRLRGDVLSPDSSLTKIWKLSEDGDEDVEVEEALDDERDERMLGDHPMRGRV